jgi:hypothetical protein
MPINNKSKKSYQLCLSILSKGRLEMKLTSRLRNEAQILSKKTPRDVSIRPLTNEELGILGEEHQILDEKIYVSSISISMFKSMLAILWILVSLAVLRRLEQFFFPEDYIANIKALHQRLQTRHKNRWLVRFIMLRAILESFWALYIQINIENLWLPKKSGSKRVDD